MDVERYDKKMLYTKKCYFKYMWKVKIQLIKAENCCFLVFVRNGEKYGQNILDEQVLQTQYTR